MGRSLCRCVWHGRDSIHCLGAGGCAGGKPLAFAKCELLAQLGEPAIRKKVPLGLARFVGGVLETIWRLFGLGGEPPMTRFVAAQLATTHWYDLTGAREDFGYDPPVAAADGLARTIDDLRARFPR